MGVHSISSLSAEPEYTVLHESSVSDRYGATEIKILVAADTLPDLNSDAIQQAADKAAHCVLSEIRGAVLRDDPKTQRLVTQERQNLLALFPGRIFVEEIPNGYCSAWCCRHIPWYVVTTEIGRFTIGWRKSVIQIDWSETVGTGSAEELFSNEDVTKTDRMIHAWGYDKANQYIDTVIASAR